MIVSLVVAYGKNKEIGVKGGLPWRLSDDLKNFKRCTMGKPIAMGRTTYESIGRPLPGRENIVLSRNKDVSIDGVTILSSLDELYSYCEGKGVEELAIIGGAKIYSQVMDRVDVMYVTEVEGSFENADAFFPSFDKESWEETESFSHPKDEKNNYAWTFKVLKRHR